MKKRFSRAMAFVCAAILLSGVAGCARVGMESLSAREGKPRDAPARDRGPAARYYDFKDVLVPGELKLDARASFVQQTADFPAGVLVFHGRVNIDSLIRFFETNMAKDNWIRMALFKSADNLMLFEKSHRRCIIFIRRTGLHPRIEIWVSPTGSTIG